MSDHAQIIAAAIQARETAYAPYSKYLVGCALSAGGQIFTGANVENASYGLSICAERVACANAALRGIRDIEAIAVITSSNPPAAPCGMCLQTLREFCVDPGALTIIMVSADGTQAMSTLAVLSPQAFHKSQLTL